MDRDELAERVVDLMYRMSLVEQGPKWPALPLMSDSDLFDKPIMHRMDPWLLQTPVVILHGQRSETGQMVLNLIRTSIAPKKLSRRFRKFGSPKKPILRYEWFYVNGNSTMKQGDFVFTNRNEQWVIAGDLLAKHRVDHRTGDWSEVGGLCHPKMVEAFVVSPGVRVMIEASWVARLKVSETSPAIELPTDSEGVYALFKDRDCHGTRKKALLHWVKSHYRTIGEKCVPVSEHLRGVFSFEWYGVDVGLTPPADSMERALQGKKTAQSVLKALERYYEALKDYEEKDGEE